MLEYEFCLDFGCSPEVVARTTVPLSEAEFLEATEEDRSELMYWILQRDDLLGSFEDNPEKARESYHWRLTEAGRKSYPGLQEDFDAYADGVEETLREWLWEASPGYEWRMEREADLRGKRYRKRLEANGGSKRSAPSSEAGGSTSPTSGRGASALDLPLDGELAVHAICKALQSRAEHLKTIGGPAGPMAGGEARKLMSAVEELQGVTSLAEAKPILERYAKFNFPGSQTREFMKKIFEQVEARLEARRGGERGEEDGRE